MIDGVDTGVENDQLPDGSTLADLIMAVLETNPELDDVVALVVALKGQGVIKGQDLGALLKAIISP